MEIIKLNAEVKVYDNESILPLLDKELLEIAIEQLEFAYAPYSKFRVGAAVRLLDGTVFPGSNQENASYPLCMCGERVALYNAAANKPSVAPATLAIVIKNEVKPIDKPVSPCGACRQVIAEFEHRYQQPIRILLKSDASKVYEIQSIKDILPLGFDASFL
ncbi:MAG: cytidine deaminase [Saprospiraceae bacterium]